MAKSQQSTSTGITRRTDEGLIEDIKNYHLKDNSWVRARNAINNSSTGDLGQIGNEPSNRFCTSAPYPITGTIHLFDDKWLLFSTDDINSEIGLFEQDSCAYRTIVNDKCLNFKRSNLISGASRETNTCSWRVYFSDGLNPDRVLDIGDPNLWPTGDYLGNNQYATGNPNQPNRVWPNVAWKQLCGTLNPDGSINVNEIGDCKTCIDTPVLDCDKIRLAKFLTPICAKVSKGDNAGVLLNGTYFVTGAYLIEGQRVTDYFLPSNLQPLFEHNNVAGSLKITFENLDIENFDEFELVVVSIINQNTVAKKFGVYSTQTQVISINNIDADLPTVDLGLLPLRNPVFETSDMMADMGNYLLRIGPKSNLDFNYQPRANLIETKWVLTEYPADYYRNGGNKTGYLRDESYVFFIRWIYNTGEKSHSSVIPGRPSIPSDRVGSGYYNSNIDGTDPIDVERWNYVNTAIIEPGILNIPTDDGGVIIRKGWMAYQQSSEIYPDNRPDLWNYDKTIPGTQLPYAGISASSPSGNFDLCGTPIRLHKFPDHTIDPILNHFRTNNGNEFIKILGVEFENIHAPVDNQGNLIPGIIGYEILRGHRDGNRSVIAKGIVNNMGSYQLPNVNQTGYYANYPYNDVNTDIFLSKKKPSLNCSIFSAPNTAYEANNIPFSQDHLTFHSPETMFNNPFLSAKELKVYGELHGDIEGRFEKVKDHPKQKLIRNSTFFLSLIAGLGIASLKASGGRRSTEAVYSVTGVPMIGTPPTSPTTVGLTQAATAALTTSNLAVTGALNTFLLNNASYLTNLVNPLVGAGVDLAQQGINAAGYVAAIGSGAGVTSPQIQKEDGEQDRISLMSSIVPTFIYYWAIGTDSALQLIRALLRYREFALQYNSHCDYNTFVNFSNNNFERREITNASYLDNSITNFDAGSKINNLYRSRTVALKIRTNLQYPNNGLEVSRIKVSDVNGTGGNLTIRPFKEVQYKLSENNRFYGEVFENPDKNSFPSKSYVYYTALKQKIVNQYGQLSNIRQIPVSTCTTIITTPVNNISKVESTGPLFNGDTYIGRYTEKNTFFYFFDWLNKQPDGYEYDYSTRRMLTLYPTFWINSEKFEVSDFIQSLNPLSLALGNGITLPNDYYNLDGNNLCSGSFQNILSSRRNLAMKFAWFYLFNSGIRDFFVESEINIDLRDWENRAEARHYDPKRFTDVKALFDVDIIKSGNFMKYDYSLSHNKAYLNFISWASLQPRDYNPTVAESCYIYRPNRILYSLPQQLELKRDNWQAFLPNNYKDFRSRTVAVKKTDLNGAMFFFENESPVKYQGVDQLQTDLGTKITIGDGGLFSQPQQNIDNSERAIEYASCQSRLGVINTPFGLFWMSQKQGKIFSIGKGIKELSMKDLKWWLSTYLPSNLLNQFPNFELFDNPVLGVGCQVTYDNDNGLIYFCKKDYTYNPILPVESISYVGGNRFEITRKIGLNNTIITSIITLQDARYFTPASWTLSYDPKIDKWLSFHDWHPDLTMVSKRTFLTIQNNGLWVHNDRCDDYCNYYGIYYPFEVELNFNSVQQVTSVRSIEYQLECYRYAPNCYDRFHVLDYNFDQMVIYNSEQCSGRLRLNLKPKNDVQGILSYPQIDPILGIIDILYSKEENKYRINQFSDITDDRGEFNPNAQRMIFNTEANGYVRRLNQFNLNYSKDSFQKKKFRHYSNNVILSKQPPTGNNTNPNKMMLVFNNTKNLISPR